MVRRGSPFEEFERIREEMNRVFERMADVFDEKPLLEERERGNSLTPIFGRENFLSDRRRVPSMNFYEVDNGYRAEIEVPGVNKEDIKLDTKNGVLRVRVDKENESSDEDKKKGYFRIERSYTGFFREIPLPEDADEDKVSASYKDGVLSLEIPKNKEEEEKVKYIKID